MVKMIRNNFNYKIDEYFSSSVDKVKVLTDRS